MKDSGLGQHSKPRKKVVKLIDYCFQHHHQLSEVHDDSNSCRHISPELDISVIGRFNQESSSKYWTGERDIDGYEVIFFPWKWTQDKVANAILAMNPDVIHMHGNHGWSQYRYYARMFSMTGRRIKLIFSPAGSSCGAEEFLSHFDKVIVNHPMQISRMRCPAEKVIVRKRSADPDVFYSLSLPKKYDFVYVAGFVPQKRIDLMIDYVLGTSNTMVILGDFTRLGDHYNFIRHYINTKGVEDQIFLHDFIPQIQMSEFLAKCKVWVWPNIKPENPETTTNRSIIEAIACGMPLLVGEQAFRNSSFIEHGINGYKYSNLAEFRTAAATMMAGWNLKRLKDHSIRINEEKFNFKKYFIDFYNDLYSNV